MNKRYIAGITLAVALAGVAGISFFHREHIKEPTYCLRYADNQPEDYPTVQAGRYFADLVEKETKGDVKIYVYPDEQLGDESSVIRQVQFGGIDMARVSSAQLIIYEPAMSVLTLPYLYRDSEHMWKVLDGEIGEKFLKSVGDSGITALSWFDAGERNFYTRKKVSRLEDFKDLKIRVQQAPFMEDLVRALGAVPESVPYSMVYARLSTGSVDGAENNWPSYRASRHDQVAKYVLLDQHVRIPEMQILSRKTEETLPQEYKDIIRECAKKAGEYERKLWKETEEESKKAAEEEGCIITELSEKEREKFYKACQPVYEKYAGKYKNLVQRIQDTQ